MNEKGEVKCEEADWWRQFDVKSDLKGVFGGFFFGFFAGKHGSERAAGLTSAPLLSSAATKASVSILFRSPDDSLSLHQCRNLFHLLRSDEDIKRGMDGGSEPARTAAGIYFLILQYTPHPHPPTPTYSLYMEPITEYTRPPLLSLAFTALGWRNICICGGKKRERAERERIPCLPFFLFSFFIVL